MPLAKEYPTGGPVRPLAHSHSGPKRRKKPSQMKQCQGHWADNAIVVR